MSREHGVEARPRQLAVAFSAGEPEMPHMLDQFLKWQCSMLVARERQK